MTYFSEPDCPTTGGYTHAVPLTEGRQCYGFGDGGSAAFEAATCAKPDTDKLRQRWTPSQPDDALIFVNTATTSIQPAFYTDARFTDADGGGWFVGGEPPLNGSANEDSVEIRVTKYRDTSPSGLWAPKYKEDFPENVTGKSHRKCDTEL